MKEEHLREIKRLTDISANGLEIVSQLFDLFEQQIRAKTAKEIFDDLFDICYWSNGNITNFRLEGLRRKWNL